MATRTWEDRELPFLEAVLEADERGEHIKDVEAAAGVMGRPADEAARVVRSLQEDRYLHGIDATTMSGYDLMEIRPAAKARRVCQQWPSENGYEDLLAIIERMIDRAEDEDQRTRLRRVLDSLKELPKPVAVSMITALLRDQLGM